MPAGRPKIQLSDLAEGWQAKVLALYEQGGSDLEVRASCFRTEKDPYYVMSDDLFYRLLEEEEEFSRTIKNGRGLAQLWWEANGRTNLKDKEFNPTLWYMNMKNRYGWADKKEVKQEIANKEGDTFKVEDVNGLDAKEVQRKLLEKINS